MKKLLLMVTICISSNLFAQPQYLAATRKASVAGATVGSGIIGKTCSNNSQCSPGVCRNNYCDYMNIPGRSDVTVAKALARTAATPSLGVVSRNAPTQDYKLGQLAAQYDLR